MPLISIAVDIAYNSPRAFSACAAIVSKLLSLMKTNDARVEMIRKIHRKLSQLPNTGHMEVWLQRISHCYEPDLPFKEPVCRLVRGEDIGLWNNDWISSTTLKATLDPSGVVDQRALKAIKPVMRPDEINIFSY